MSGCDPEQARLAYWWEMADESLASARADLADGRLHGAVNRAYYGCFYAVTAVFASAGVSHSKHTEARAALHRDLIRPGLVEVDWGRFYNLLYDARHTGDYREFVKFDAAEVATWVERAGLLAARLKQLVADRAAGDEEHDR